MTGDFQNQTGDLRFGPLSGLEQNRTKLLEQNRTGFA
jgi:hypothetical protein